MIHIVIYETDESRSILDMSCDINVLGVSCDGRFDYSIGKHLRKKSKMIEDKVLTCCKKYSESQLLGRALILKDEKIHKTFAAMYIERLTKGGVKQEIDLNALSRSLTQVYNYAKVNHMNTIALPYKLGCNKTSNVTWFDIEDVIYFLFENTVDITCKIYMK